MFHDNNDNNDNNDSNDNNDNNDFSKIVVNMTTNLPGTYIIAENFKIVKGEFENIYTLIASIKDSSDNKLITHAKYINTIDEKVKSYKEEINEYNTTLGEIKDMIIDEFENYDKNLDEIKKENNELNKKIHDESYTINFIIIAVIILFIIIIYNDLIDSNNTNSFKLIDVISKYNNGTLDNDTIITIVDNRISEL